MPTQSVWNNSRKVTAYLLNKLENNADDTIPWAPRDGDTLEESIRRYQQAAAFDQNLEDAMNYSFALADSLQARLVQAHRAAALIQVKGVDEAVAKKLASDLDAISEAVKKDQRFTAVAQVAGALAEALNKQAK